MMISIIAAISENHVIGMDEKIPWKIPGEQKRFKDLTLGKTVIMGRKTYESIGRPLPGRNTIVISRSRKFEGEHCITAGSLTEALEKVSSEDEVFIAGGGEIYREALPYAAKLYLTVVHEDFAGNIFFPRFNAADYIVTFKDRIEGEIPYTYYTYERKAP